MVNLLKMQIKLPSKKCSNLEILSAELIGKKMNFLGFVDFVLISVGSFSIFF